MAGCEGGDPINVRVKAVGDGEIIKTSGKLNPGQMEDVAKAGAEIVKAAVSQQIITKRKTDVGAGIAESVDYQIYGGLTATYARVGWKASSVKLRGSGIYRDKRGRRRKAYTTADIGGILEYSTTRQLRHMEPGFEESEENALDAMEKQMNAVIDNLIE